MAKEVAFYNSTISYSISGKGEPLTLLHGYLMSSAIWHDFSALLTLKYRVLSIDLPGHGNSGNFPPVHSMDLMAEAVEAVFKNEKIEHSYILGHSMGGYVGLAILEHYPYRIKKLILLNTYPFEDTDQKIAVRNKIIRLLRKEKKELLLQQLFRELIPLKEEGNFTAIRESALRVASIQSTGSLIATTNGIKLRPDRSFLLQEPKVPVKWILSRSDEQLDTADIMNRARKMSITEPELIEGNHMSFLEDPNEIFRIANNYLSN